MTRTCKLCGQPITGKNKFCESCKRQKKREYQRNRYNNNSEYREKKIQQSRKNQQKREKLGTHYQNSPHRQPDFEKEKKVVKNMSKKAFSGKKITKKNNNGDYNKIAYNNYKQATSYEKKKLNTVKTCPICSGTHFIRDRGLIVCTTCGLTSRVFSNTIYGFDTFTEEELENDKFVQALRKKLGVKKSE